MIYCVIFVIFLLIYILVVQMYIAKHIIKTIDFIREGCVDNVQNKSTSKAKDKKRSEAARKMWDKRRADKLSPASPIDQKEYHQS